MIYSIEKGRKLFIPVFYSCVLFLCFIPVFYSCVLSHRITPNITIPIEAYNSHDSYWRIQPGQFFCFNMLFRRKALHRRSATPNGKSWIRHCVCITVNFIAVALKRQMVLVLHQRTLEFFQVQLFFAKL